MLAIETIGLTKCFGENRVVDGVSLRVPVGCVYGFLGPNGAGKTTTMRLLLGLVKADVGSIQLLGHDLRKHRKNALLAVGSLIEAPSLYPHLNGRHNLELTCQLLGLPLAEIDRVLEVVDLSQTGNAPVSIYSLGMKQRLALARALLGQPKLLLLDEPTNGLDPDGIIAMRTIIRALPERIGGTVLVSSHHLTEVEQVADYAGVMRAGRLVVQQEVRALLNDEPTFIFSVDDVVSGVMLLRAHHLGAHPDGEHKIRLLCTPVQTEQQVAAANRILVEAGHSVSSIVRQHRTLESVYRNAQTHPFPSEIGQ